MTAQILSRWAGNEAQYNKYRPGVPVKLRQILLRYLQCKQIELVVDLGCGTGNSTRSWSSCADKVIGIDPSENMIRMALRRTKNKNVNYRIAYGHQTTLPDGVASLVTASSSIHWMEPETTLREIKRILRPYGLFAFWGPSHPPVTPFMQLDQSYVDFVAEINANKLLLTMPQRWKWETILETINKNNLFILHRYFNLEAQMHWNKNDYKNWLFTTNEIPGLLNSGHEKFKKALDRFTDSIDKYLGLEKHPVFFVYNIHAFMNDSEQLA